MTKKSALEELAALLSEAHKPKPKSLPESNEIVNDDYIQNLANRITPQKMQEQAKDPLAPLDQNFVTFKDMNDHYTLFINRIQQQLASIGGGGEVNFRYLDDVNRSTMTGSNDNWVLEYDSATGGVQFTNNIGPIESIWFDPNHVDDHTETGTLCWNKDDQTLNLHHPNGVKQQIGQELYGYVRNKTGSTISNGTAVQFAGAEQNGTARLLVSPMLADGSVSSLFVFGVATENIAHGDDGCITVWGKVRGLDTSDWEVGDLLYVSPTVAGQMTNVKPTSPDNSIPVAAVLSKDAEDGEIFVRPTIEQQMLYGTFSDSTDQTVANPNEATAITLNTSEKTFGVSIDSVDPSKVVFSQSGLYSIGINVQLLSTNSSAKNVWFWIRKNDEDIPLSSRVVSVVGNNVYTVFEVTHNVSFDANDYLQLMWASSDDTVSLKAVPSTAFAPASPSVHLHIDQVAL